MWTATASIATTASPQALWRLFEDVAGWTNWSPGRGVSRSTPRDETLVDGTRFLVSHELQPLPPGGTRVRYALRVEGPEAETLGTIVMADFSEVLAALKALAEHACDGTT
jgi:hypothetical protein